MRLNIKFPDTMKNLFIILLIITFGWQCAQSQDNISAFRFVWNEANYLFYDTYDVLQLQFQSSLPADEISRAAQKVGVIDKIQVDNGTGIIYFKENPLPSDIRKFAEKMGISEIYVSKARILTSSLLDKDELDKIKKDVPRNQPFISDYNKTGTPENIEFNIHYFSSKIYSMQITDYPRYLYSGDITSYTEHLIQFKAQSHNLKLKK